MKNKKALLFGLAGGILSVSVLPLIFQAAAALLLQLDFEYVGGGLRILQQADKVEGTIFFILSPLSIIIGVEFCAFLLKKIPPGYFRYSLIFVILINIGYLIFSIFYGAFAVILQADAENIWVNLTGHLQFEQTGRIVFMFFVLIVLMAYLRSMGRIVNEYVQNKQR